MFVDNCTRIASNTSKSNINSYPLPLTLESIFRILLSKQKSPVIKDGAFTVVTFSPQLPQQNFLSLFALLWALVKLYQFDTITVITATIFAG